MYGLKKKRIYTVSVWGLALSEVGTWYGSVPRWPALVGLAIRKNPVGKIPCVAMESVSLYAV